MLFFTVIGHFVYTKGMTMMIPGIIRFKTAVIYITGIFEILLGTGLLIPNLRIYSAWSLILLLSSIYCK